MKSPRRERYSSKLLCQSLRLALVVGALSSVGCGSVRVEHSLTGKAVAVHRGEVRIVMEGGEQPTDLEEVAIIQVYAQGTKAKLPIAIDALKARARELGCDTVAKVSVDRGAAAMSVTGTCGVTL